MPVCRGYCICLRMAWYLVVSQQSRLACSTTLLLTLCPGRFLDLAWKEENSHIRRREYNVMHHPIAGSDWGFYEELR